MADLFSMSPEVRVSPQPSGSDDPSSQALSEALGSSMILLRLLVLALLVAFVFSCVFTVKPNEAAVVLRFGRPRGEGMEAVLRQGLHWALPRPIDEIVKIPVGESLMVRSTIAWYEVDPALEVAGKLPEASPSLRPGVDGHVLTSDGNLLHVRASMKYRIADPLSYAFQFRDFTNLLVNALNNSIYYASAHTTAEGALYKQLEFKEAIRTRLEEVLLHSQLKVTLEPLDLEVSAPLFVRNSFDDVTRAEQTRSTKINAAKGDAEEIIRKAQGEADAIRANGNVMSNMLVQTVSAEAKYFQDQLPSYRRNPSLFRERKRLEVFADVFNSASNDKFFVPARTDGQSRELRLQLNREPQAPKKN